MNKYPYIDIFLPSLFFGSPFLPCPFPWRIRKITPLHTLQWSCVPRSPLREDLSSYRLQKSASRLDRGAGEGQKEKGVGKNQTYASICTVFSCTPFSAILGGAAGKTALFAKPQQCKSFRASSCLYVWTRIGQCTVRTAAGEKKKGRYASLDIIGKKRRKWMLIFYSLAMLRWFPFPRTLVFVLYSCA